MADQAATQQDLSKLAKAILDFKDKYEKITDVHYGAAIARTGDNQLMQEYGDLVARMNSIKSKIETVEGLWEKAKELVGLGFLPLIPIAVAVALTATVIGGVIAMKAFMKKAGIAQIQADNPTMTYAQASAQYNSLNQSDLGKTVSIAKLALWLGGAFLGWQVYKEFRR